jgi:uncharacterized protein DUF4236
MTLRFRKVFGRKPFRWTLTKRGIGGSWGIPGLRFGLTPSGDRFISIGIAGTGFYWIKYFKARQRGPATPSQTDSQTSRDSEIEWNERR